MEKSIGTPEWVLVTPEMAALYVDCGEYNRKIRKATVARYAEDMANGNWRPSPDVVVIGIDGKCINGNHRLSAVILSGVSVHMLVAFWGETMLSIRCDTGQKRTLSDVTGENKKFSETVNFISMLYTSTKFAIRNAVSIDSSLPIMSAFRDDIYIVQSYGREKSRIVSQAGVRAAVVLQYIKNNRDNEILEQYKRFSFIEDGRWLAVQRLYSSMDGCRREDRSCMFARAYCAFSPEYRHGTNPISPAKVKYSLEGARRIISQVMADYES